MMQNRALANTGEGNKDEKQGPDYKVSHKPLSRKMPIKLLVTPDPNPNPRVIIVTACNSSIIPGDAD
jgi:hypothetical protein